MNNLPTRYRDPFTPESWAAGLFRLAPSMRRDDVQLRSFAEAHMEGDPLADALVEWMASRDDGRQRFEAALTGGLTSVQEPAPALRAFFEQVERVPAWLDRGRIEVAKDLFHRAYWGAERVLFSAGLLAGYVSGGVSMVLSSTGALERMAQRRFAETQKFVCDVYGPEHMSRFSDGFCTTIRVRVMHAMVRRQLLARGFDVQAYGVPINQADMAATSMQFSITYLLGLRGLGYHVSADEVDAVLHLWRYVGLLMGIRAELLPSTEREARQQLRLSVASQAGPNDESRALARALMAIELKPVAPQGRLERWDMAYRGALARLSVGSEAADALELPDTPWKLGVLATIPVVYAAECLRRCVPGATSWAVELGKKLERESLAERLAGKLPSYQPHQVPPNAVSPERVPPRSAA